MIPFTVDQFFSVFTAYNTAIWPAQVVAYALGGAAFVAACRPTRYSGRIIGTVLVAFWLWTGVAYHLWQFTGINPAAYVFGILFIIQAILFLLVGVAQDRLSFRVRADLVPVAGLTLIVYAAIIYGVLSYLTRRCSGLRPARRRSSPLASCCWRIDLCHLGS